ncbi:MAG: nitrogenase component 1 [Eubacterium sp.]|nr:nitrogenase component 1 [Eubacterium sp.]
MNCCMKESVFETSLHYASPAHGGWGVLKAAQLIPDSYFLFVSPAACGRHGALGARMEGRKKRVSYLFLTEQSIVSGDYEQMLKDAVSEVMIYLEKRNRKPKVMGIFVSCIDDLLGTDHVALMDELEADYPGVRFIDCHMNPTSTDTGIPPLVNVQNKLYLTLEQSDKKDMGVNIIGNLEAVKKSSELYEVLEKTGVSQVRHISYFDSFENYQDMSKSRLNILVAPSGEYACKNMSQKLGIPYEKSFIAFRPQNIRENYEKISSALGEKCPDLDEYEAEAYKALKEAKEYLNGAPLIIDEEAITRPFEFARCLLENGMNVRRIYSQQVLPSDKENYEWVSLNHPEIQIRQPQNPKVTVEEHVDEDWIAIGYSAGYLSGAKHVVDIGGQNGLYGYKGLMALLEKIKDSKDKTADLKQIIDDAVLIV